MRTFRSFLSRQRMPRLTSRVNMRPIFLFGPVLKKFPFGILWEVSIRLTRAN